MADPRGQQGHELGQYGDLWWVPGGRYSQAYGNTNSRYEYGYHDGVDIAVPAGTGLAALTDGIVVYAGDSGSDGLRVGIKMPNGKVYYYGHLSSINVQVGDRVGRGQVIARSGNTGNSTGPHVHFELHRRPGSGPGDSPQKFLARWGGGTIKDSTTGTGGARRYPKGS